MGYCNRHQLEKTKEIYIFSGSWSSNAKPATLDMTKISLNTEFVSPEPNIIPATVADA